MIYIALKLFVFFSLCRRWPSEKRANVCVCVCLVRISVRNAPSFEECLGNVALTRCPLNHDKFEATNWNWNVCGVWKEPVCVSFSSSRKVTQFMWLLFFHSVCISHISISDRHTFELVKTHFRRALKIKFNHFIWKTHTDTRVRICSMIICDGAHISHVRSVCDYARDGRIRAASVRLSQSHGECQVAPHSFGVSHVLVGCESIRRDVPTSRRTSQSESSHVRARSVFECRRAIRYDASNRWQMARKWIRRIIVYK